MLLSLLLLARIQLNAKWNFYRNNNGHGALSLPPMSKTKIVIHFQICTMYACALPPTALKNALVQGQRRKQIQKENRHMISLSLLFF